MKFSLEFDGTADELDQLLARLGGMASKPVALTPGGKPKRTMSEEGKRNVQAGSAKYWATKKAAGGE